MYSEDLVRLGFEKTSITISLVNGSLEYSGLSNEKINSEESAGVYVILSESSEQIVNMVYVGKAGKGVHRRFSQHAAGYKRNVKQSTVSAGTRRMRDKFTTLGVQRLDVWFRESPSTSFAEHFGSGADQTRISTYSLEEELLIARFFNCGLINAQVPVVRDQESIEPDAIENVLNTSVPHSSQELVTAYRQAVESWSSNTRGGVNAILRDREADLAALTPRVSLYSSGLFKNQPVLVFGVWGEAQFKPNSKRFLLNMTGGSFVEWPFGGAEQVEVTDTATYLDIE